jgi:hypothetical protein
MSAYTQPITPELDAAGALVTRAGIQANDTERKALAADLFAIAHQEAIDTGRIWSPFAAAVELERRIGGAVNLRRYLACLMIARP